MILGPWTPPYQLDIEKTLEFTSEDINWVLIVYNITFAASLLVGGQLGQKFGLEKIFISGAAILAISNIINTVAPNKGTLLAGRTISGIGAGLTAPNGLAILNTAFPDGMARNKALAIYTACAPLGSTIGTVIGSLLSSSSAGWRSIFWLCLIFTAMALVLACLFLPSFDKKGDVRIDIVGSLVFVTGIVLLVYGLNDSSRIGWSSAPVLVGIILGICLLGVFVFIEIKIVINPCIPHYVWKNLPFFFMLFVIFAFGGSFSSWFFISTQLCVNRLGYTTILTAVYILPAAFSAIVSGMLSTQMIKFTGEKVTLVIGLAITAAGAVAWTFASPELAGRTDHHSGYWYIIVASIIFVCGSPPAMVPAQSILLRQVDAKDSAVAGALFNTAYQIGASVLLAGANTFMNGNQKSLLAGVIGAAAIIVAVFYWPQRVKQPEGLIEEAIADEKEMQELKVKR
ncbi:hypothetical protein N7495_006235 [Penicillium taxi]|uniref:uncharacterized protein n=1 Tax=Penicillium taxi TaxID=168475 RepID=UPI0025452D86|nr:uncharacterized protein N7495_006235 [Penicillium taxi]KAJ5894544.1 hypothetical protein N7495_006235 [Penicillium taxi]